jgi:hypothetical protein
MTSPTDFNIIHNAIKLYERASEACLNPKKSKALAIGIWNVPATVLGIELHTHVKILEVTFGSSLEEAMKETWAHITRTVRAQERNTYARDLCFAHRVQYVQSCLLAMIW